MARWALLRVPLTTAGQHQRHHADGARAHVQRGLDQVDLVGGRDGVGGDDQKRDSDRGQQEYIIRDNLSVNTTPRIRAWAARRIVARLRDFGAGPSRSDGADIA